MQFAYIYTGAGRGQDRLELVPFENLYVRMGFGFRIFIKMAAMSVDLAYAEEEFSVPEALVENVSCTHISVGSIDCALKSLRLAINARSVFPSARHKLGFASVRTYVFAVLLLPLPFALAEMMSCVCLSSLMHIVFLSLVGQVDVFLYHLFVCLFVCVV